MTDLKRFAFFLPNSFTALNLACGFASMIFAVAGNYYYAAMILVLGSIFDSVDGRVARLTGTQSAFGEQFDSMSDIVSFGVAPALLVYYKFLADYGRLGMVIAFIFVLCGALRLARFNANIDDVSSDFFQGLPIPMAAMAQIGLVLFSLVVDLDHVLKPLAIIYTLFYSFLMISNIRFCSFKKSEFVKKNAKAMLFFIFIVICLTFLFEEYTILSMVTLYVIFSLIYFFLNKGKFVDIVQWEDGKVD